MKELTLARDRNETKYKKYEEENKKMASLMERETKSKWEIEKEKMKADKDLRDAQKLVDHLYPNISFHSIGTRCTTRDYKTKGRNVQIANTNKIG